MEKHFVATIVTAMPEEAKAILRFAEQKKKQTLKGAVYYEGFIEGRKFWLAVAGMGVSAASVASGIIISLAKPSIVVSAGFCGAVRKGAEVADLVVCGDLQRYSRAGLETIALEGGRQTAARISSELNSRGLRAWPGSFITTETIVGKSEISGILPEDIRTPVLEMESAAVAVAAKNVGIPFLGIRSVSDPSDEELGFTIDEFTDSDMRISIPRVIKTCLRKPRIIPQLARLASNSSKAAETLGSGVARIIRML